MLPRRALLDAITAVPFIDRDAWVDATLGFVPPLDDDVTALPRGAVPYVPCGVDAILACVRDVPIDESVTFIDLGAGAGRVVLLVHALTHARGIGVEVQPHLVAEARRMARALDVEHRVSFIERDARALGDLDLELELELELEGAHLVFFIYASFSPAVLARVLDVLEHRARSARVTLCAVGFDVDVARASFVARASSSPEVSIYDVTSKA